MTRKTPAIGVEEAFLKGDAQATDVPIWMLEKGAALDALGLTDAQKKWADATRFKGKPKQQTLVPAPDGRIASVLMGTGKGETGEPCGPPELLLGQMARTLPAGHYRLAQPLRDPTLAAVAWGLGSYRFRRYRNGNDESAQLRIPDAADKSLVVDTVEAVWQGRDLINTPASDMGPAELELAARNLAQRFGATVEVIEGDDLLTHNLPLIHAVGRASPRAPRLIDLRWGREKSRAVTLVGKGICFDTGGLDIKPASGMLIMKKDMGGAAAVLTLGHMIMAQKLDVRLRILIPAAENSISGNAFRPGDVLTSRAGTTIEVGNTDAEGRLVLADAATLGDEANPHSLFIFATLTGAARVALGPDLPAFFTDDDDFAARLLPVAASVGDPVWRMPLWAGYDSRLESQIADLNNIGDMPMGGAIIAALFLKRFVKRARRFAHFDIFGWRPAQAALGPKGGEPHAARGLFTLLKQECAP
jgi:leucyl aminopeptidase